MVDIEHRTVLLREKNVISAKEKKIICQSSRKIFYAERTESRLMRELERTIGPGCLKCLLAYTSGVIPNIKYLDAKRAVEHQRCTYGSWTSAVKQQRKGELQWPQQNIQLGTTV
jgi:hypothetical protein